jgi:hypothetical protein
MKARSLVRKRHRLVIAGKTWNVETPFFWWQQLTATLAGELALVGRVGPTTMHWGFVVKPEHDSLEFLAAVAFLHWKWWRW